jgi:polygalacturonase
MNARLRPRIPFAALFLLCAAAPAQDSRKVGEPSIPPACAVLLANIGRAGGSIAPEDETRLDTGRIQAAMDQCAPGHAVVLRRAAPRKDAFLSGPLDLRKGVTLVVERGAYLYASRDPRDYDRTPGVCGSVAPTGGGCRALINGENAADSGVMGDGVIDGRGGETILGRALTWWNLADEARQGGSQNNPRLIALSHCDNFVLYRITLMNSPEFHVRYRDGNGFTAWGVRIWCPERARNTDGIDPGNSTNVTIAHCYIHTGDDQVAIKAGSGAPTTHLSIVHNHFYAGHGMSIGSETEGGASAVLVADLSIDGADNGLRIKSAAGRGGLVRDVTYEDICIRATAVPVSLETSYSAIPATAPRDGALIPQYREITFRNVRVQGEGKLQIEGVDEAHRLGVRFDNVVFDDPAKIKTSVRHAEVTSGPGPFNLRIAGDDVSVQGSPGKARPNGCAAKFVPFPLE